MLDKPALVLRHVCGGLDMYTIVIASLLFSIVFDSLHCPSSYLCHLPFRLTRSVANESPSDNIGCVLSFQCRVFALYGFALLESLISHQPKLSLHSLSYYSKPSTTWPGAVHAAGWIQAE